MGAIVLDSPEPPRWPSAREAGSACASARLSWRATGTGARQPSGVRVNDPMDGQQYEDMVSTVLMIKAGSPADVQERVGWRQRIGR